MKLRTNLIAFAIGAAGTAALAQNNAPDSEGFYVGLGANATQYNLKRTDFISGKAASRSFDETDTGYKLFAGYRFTQNFALEAQYASLGEARIRYRAASGQQLGEEKFKFDAFSVSAVGLLPIGSELTLFGKAGVVRAKVESSFNPRGFEPNAKWNDTGAVLGLGASYALGRHVDLRGEFERYTELGKSDSPGRSSVNAISLGLQYRF